MEKILYLDKVVDIKGSKYRFGKKIFSTIYDAIEYAKRKDVYGLMKPIHIINNDAIGILPEELINNITIRNSKDILCKYAKERIIYFSKDMNEVYMEYFSLADDSSFKYHIDFCFDYGILYAENIPEFNQDLDYGSYTSTLVPFPITICNNEFLYKKNELDNMYDGNDILQIYRCMIVRKLNDDGNIYGYTDVGFSKYSIPASTIYKLREPAKNIVVPITIDINTHPYKKKKFSIRNWMWELIYKDRIC